MSVFRGALLLCFGIAVGLLWLFPDYVVDDAYIYYRYAQNLATHGELTFNVGEDPVEGYTGFAVPILLAVGIRLGLHPTDVVHGIGAGCHLLSVALMALILRRLRVRRWLTVSSVLLYTTAPALYTHAFNGLETSAYICSVLAVLWALSTVLQNGGGRPGQQVRLALLMLVACLVRPEGVMASAMAAAAWFWVLSKEHGWQAKSYVGSVSRLAACLVVPYGAYFWWRVAYYGHLLPNTAQAKQGTGGIQERALNDLVSFSELYLLLPTLAMVVLAVHWPVGKKAEALGSAARGVLGATAGFLLVVTTKYLWSHLAMGFSYRFYVPHLPLVLVGEAVLAEWALRRWWPHCSFAMKATRLSIVMAVIGYQGSVSWSEWPKETKFARDYAAFQKQQHLPIGHLLRAAVPQEEWIVGVIDAGAIPYLAGHRTIDMGDLNDEYLARHKRPKDRADYVFGHNPGAIYMTSKRMHRPWYIRGKPLYKDARLKERYKLIRRYHSKPEPRPKTSTFVYLRRDLASRISKKSLPTEGQWVGTKPRRKRRR